MALTRSARQILPLRCVMGWGATDFSAVRSIARFNCSPLAPEMKLKVIWLWVHWLGIDAARCARHPAPCRWSGCGRPLLLLLHMLCAGTDHLECVVRALPGGASIVPCRRLLSRDMEPSQAPEAWKSNGCERVCTP